MHRDYRISDVDQAIAEVFRAMCEEFEIVDRGDQLVLLSDISASVAKLRRSA